LEQISRDRPNIVVLDLSVEGSDPLRTIQEINRRFPEIRVILYSSEDDQHLIDKAIKAGACKHVHKEHGIKSLLDAIYEAVATPAKDRHAIHLS
jgi:DNA-binding NarL/FixJ family response regulator